MAYEIISLPAAERTLMRLPADIQDGMITKIKALAESPRPAGAVKMAGSANLYRIRERTYRVVYAVEDRFLWCWL